jgi:hypothetical protein
MPLRADQLADICPWSRETNTQQGDHRPNQAEGAHKLRAMQFARPDVSFHACENATFARIRASMSGQLQSFLPLRS